MADIWKHCFHRNSYSTEFWGLKLAWSFLWKFLMAACCIKLLILIDKLVESFDPRNLPKIWCCWNIYSWRVPFPLKAAWTRFQEWGGDDDKGLECNHTNFSKQVRRNNEQSHRSQISRLDSTSFHKQRVWKEESP